MKNLRRIILHYVAAFKKKNYNTHCYLFIFIIGLDGLDE